MIDNKKMIDFIKENSKRAYPRALKEVKFSKYKLKKELKLDYGYLLLDDIKEEKIPSLFYDWKWRQTDISIEKLYAKVKEKIEKMKHTRTYKKTTYVDIDITKAKEEFTPYTHFYYFKNNWRGTNKKDFLGLVDLMVDSSKDLLEIKETISKMFIVTKDEYFKLLKKHFVNKEIPSEDFFKTHDFTLRYCTFEQ